MTGKDRLPHEKGFHISWDQIHRDSRALAWRLDGQGPNDGAWRAVVAITRGGMAPEIWLMDRRSRDARNISNSDANDAQPMWHGQTLYFLSDRWPAQRNNIWAMEIDSGQMRQVTRFSEFDDELLRLYRNRSAGQTIPNLYPPMLSWAAKQRPAEHRAAR